VPNDATQDQSTGDLTWNIPQESFKTSLGDSSGSNYYARLEETLYFTMSAGDNIEVKSTQSIILKIGLEMQSLTTTEFFENGNFALNIAALLGVDPSKIKVVNVIREDTPSNRRRRNTPTAVLTIEVADGPAPSVPEEVPEIDNVGTTAAPIDFTTTVGLTTAADDPTTAQNVVVDDTSGVVSSVVDGGACVVVLAIGACVVDANVD